MKNNLSHMIVFTLLLSLRCLCLEAADNKIIEQAIVNSYSTRYPWLQRGKMYTYAVRSTDSINYLAVYYCYDVPSDPDQTALTGSMDGFSLMIDKEIEGKNMGVFIGKDLPGLLAAFLPFEQTNLLDSIYLKNYENSLHADADLHGDINTFKILSELCAALKVEVNSNGWRIAFNVIHPDGSVERWSFDGVLDRFLIKSWNREVVVEKGKIKPLPRSL